MANYVRPVVDAVAAVLEKYTPALLAAMETPRDPFREYLRAFTGQLKNPPAVWVMPGRTAIDPEATVLRQQSVITVRIGVTGSEPEDLMDAALDYVRAVSDAVLVASGGADWGQDILRVFPEVHDYGPLYTQGKAFARFPEVHLVADHAELMPEEQ